ncbi:hypothetical protein PHET_06689 [Paragonimus heterotremus]|uniref:C2H2-type domain-containing protein n=1 Tax=Paragonimus heterotremus TaxID=100268 RepID=A0A8J4WSV3_9TREM|nr:hypothetical protein PHET_06689 [Paragonimus heterotremus]
MDPIKSSVDLSSIYGFLFTRPNESVEDARLRIQTIMSVHKPQSFNRLSPSSPRKMDGVVCDRQLSQHPDQARFLHYGVLHDLFSKYQYMLKRFPHTKFFWPDGRLRLSTMNTAYFHHLSTELASSYRKNSQSHQDCSNLENAHLAWTGGRTSSSAGHIQTNPTKFALTYNDNMNAYGKCTNRNKSGTKFEESFRRKRQRKGTHSALSSITKVKSMAGASMSSHRSGTILHLISPPNARVRARLAKIPNLLGPYNCRLCGEEFGDAFKLAGHRCPCIAHTDYRCPECEKVFNCPANLASHRRWHKPKSIEPDVMLSASASQLNSLPRKSRQYQLSKTSVTQAPDQLTKYHDIGPGLMEDSSYISFGNPNPQQIKRAFGVTVDGVNAMVKGVCQPCRSATANETSKRTKTGMHSFSVEAILGGVYKDPVEVKIQNQQPEFKSNRSNINNFALSESTPSDTKICALCGFRSDTQECFEQHMSEHVLEQVYMFVRKHSTGRM